MIDRESIIEVIKDYQEMDLPDLVERDIDIPLDLKIKRAISIIGPRRAGKTYTMFQLMKTLLSKGIVRNRILYINFEDYRLEGINYSDLEKIIEVYYEMYPENSRLKVWFFLDEIQNVEGWEKVVRNIMDRWNTQVFLSGSSSKLLSREIATQLRGRTLTYIVYPFSFKEFLRARNFRIEKYMSSYKKNMLLNLLNEYIVYGGYPEAVTERERRMKILREIWDVTIARDIIDRWKIRNIKALKLLIKALRGSREFSIHKFYRYLKSLGLKISKNTLYNYIKYLNDSLIIFLLKKYSPSYKDVEMSIPKIFFVDNGLYMAEEDLGKMMENLVFMELKRRNYVENENLFYWKNSLGREVDFVIIDKELIQVCYELTYENKNREIRSLVKASKKLNFRNLRILTWNQENTIIVNNKKIKVTPLWKWLIDKSVKLA
ncbi:MAG: ATPase [Thermofilum sp. ex4484_79]|nr:MAG: ATPase [Thermofilum sp. ex4484_79]